MLTEQQLLAKKRYLDSQHCDCSAPCDSIPEFVEGGRSRLLCARDKTVIWIEEESNTDGS